MDNFNLVYFGSPQFSADILTFISQKLTFLNLQAVVTQPDRPQGRNQSLTPSPVAQAAKELNVPVFKPQTLNQDNLDHLKLLKPHLFLVVAYGQILPPAWLTAPQLSPLNLHFSLLPQYRGALCVSQAIKNQDQHTGVTLMEMDQKLDHGPIVAQIKQAISQTDNVHSLTQKLTDRAKSLLKLTLPTYLHFKTSPSSPSSVSNRSEHSLQLHLPPRPQNHSQASYTPPTSQNNHQNAFIPWSKVAAAQKGDHAAQTHAFIRSFNPDPGAWTKIPTQKGKLKTKLITTALQDNQLVIKKLQLPSKQPISFQQFKAGYQITD